METDPLPKPPPTKKVYKFIDACDMYLCCHRILLLPLPLKKNQRVKKVIWVCSYILFFTSLYLSSSDIDETDIIEPDNDPPQEMGDPSKEVMDAAEERGGGTVYSRLHLFTIAPATYCPHVATLATVIV